jgi:hypothetical protein
MVAENEYVGKLLGGVVVILLFFIASWMFRKFKRKGVKKL